MAATCCLIECRLAEHPSLAVTVHSLGAIHRYGRPIYPSCFFPHAGRRGWSDLSDPPALSMNASAPAPPSPTPGGPRHSHPRSRAAYCSAPRRLGKCQDIPCVCLHDLAERGAVGKQQHRAVPDQLGWNLQSSRAARPRGLIPNRRAEETRAASPPACGAGSAEPAPCGRTQIWSSRALGSSRVLVSTAHTLSLRTGCSCRAQPHAAIANRLAVVDGELPAQLDRWHYLGAMNLLGRDLGRGGEMMTFAPPIQRQRRAVVAQQLGVQGLQ